MSATVLAPRASVPPRRFLLLVAAVAAAGLLALTAAAASAHAGRRAAPLGAGTPGLAARSAAGLTGRDSSGRAGPLLPNGGVLLVVASTCPHCHRTLAALAADGALPPRLAVVALDGAAAGARLLDSLGIRAPVLEPGDASAFRRQLAVRGTPLLLRLTPAGRVTDGLLGEPSPAQRRVWRAYAAGADGAEAR